MRATPTVITDGFVSIDNATDIGSLTTTTNIKLGAYAASATTYYNASWSWAVSAEL
jgi:hypothetical protein